MLMSVDHENAQSGDGVLVNTSKCQPLAVHAGMSFGERGGKGEATTAPMERDT